MGGMLWPAEQAIEDAWDFLDWEKGVPWPLKRATHVTVEVKIEQDKPAGGPNWRRERKKKG